MESQRRVGLLVCALAVFLAAPFQRTSGQVFEGLRQSLQALSSRLPVGDPGVPSTWEGGKEGPKGIASGDLNGDGRPDIAVSNLDGTITVYINLGHGKFGSPPYHLRTAKPTLREVIIADLTGEGIPDIVACALGASAVVVFPNGPSGIVTIPTWSSARNLAAGDFDGDGRKELAVAGADVGLALYKALPGGAFVKTSELKDLPGLIPENFDPMGGGSKPVYSLKAFRPLRSPRDELVMTHALADKILVLAVGPGMTFQSWRSIDAVYGIYDLDVAPIVVPTGPAGLSDLVTVHRDAGVVQIRSGIDSPDRFSSAVRQEIQINGGPRAAQLLDLNGDRWNDLVVVVRNFDIVLTFRNELGMMVDGSEMPVGQSPRDLAPGDFDGDGQTDVAVINRISGDVSILTAFLGEAGFTSLDHLYLVDGEAVDLAVQDLNLDGEDDVVQLHRALGEVSVRLAGESGILHFAKYYPMGTLPNALRVADLNGDHNPDLITANLGRRGVEPGAIIVRLGDGTGEFLGERRFPVPVEGLLFSLEVADFDSPLDGSPDIAAGFLDYRIGFFKNTGNWGDANGACPGGSWGKECGLTFVRAGEFVHDGRGMAAGDFNCDGKIDLAGAGWMGELVVLENRGDFLAGPSGPDRTVTDPTTEMFRTKSLRAKDLNGDGDLDLILTSESGSLVYLGSQGTDFDFHPGAFSEDVQNLLANASTSVLADFDGDGDQDLALGGRTFSVVTLFLQEGIGSGRFLPAFTVDVPAGNLLATGSIDGDDYPDLIGSGEALWTALSDTRPTQAPPFSREDDVGRRIPGPVLNELLAVNRNLPVGDEVGTPEWIEIFNGGPNDKPLSGYKLRLFAPGGEVPEGLYTIEAGTVLKKEGFLLLLCTKEHLPGHTGFRLPQTGGTLTLEDPQGNEVDRVGYPSQRQDISFGRLRDGLYSWAFKQIPTPGTANIDYGPISPTIRIEAAVPESWKIGDPIVPPVPGEPLRILARGQDDTGIVSVRLFYGDLDTPADQLKWIELFDDGRSGDGDLMDGFFSGVLKPGFPAGGGGCIAVEVEGLEGEIGRDPPDPDPQDPGDRGSYCLEFEETPEIEILEIVASNILGYTDEGGGHPDWVEVGNVGSEPVSLDGIYLGERYPSNQQWYEFPKQRTLAPGESIVIFCDRRPDQSDLHAPFELNSEEGGRLVIAAARLGIRTAYRLVDARDYPPMPTDVAYAKLDGHWGFAPPSPGASNPKSAALVGDVNVSGIPLDLSDSIGILSYLFLKQQLGCLNAADANQDGAIDISDPIFLLFYLFCGGEEPPLKAVSCF